MSGLRVDHVICAVDDAETSAAAFTKRYGLASVPGGRHPGWGTENRIVPLGDSYVELVGVCDPEEAQASDFGRRVLDAVRGGQGLLGWAVATHDIESVARRLHLEVADGSRTRPDGSTLRWRLAGVARALESGALPFFIEWEGPGELHPGAASADHSTPPLGTAWVEVAADEETVRAWLGDHDLPLRLIDGPPALTAVGIATSGREIVLR
jgi:hypothetical protein